MGLFLMPSMDLPVISREKNETEKKNSMELNSDILNLKPDCYGIP